jgi:hypothetical protein
MNLEKVEIGSVIKLDYSVPKRFFYGEDTELEPVLKHRMALVCACHEDQYGRTNYSVVYLDNGELCCIEDRAIHQGSLVGKAGEFMVKLIKDHFQK